jgi:hypothetical protein
MTGVQALGLGQDLDPLLDRPRNLANWKHALLSLPSEILGRLLARRAWSAFIDSAPSCPPPAASAGPSMTSSQCSNAGHQAPANASAPRSADLTEAAITHSMAFPRQVGQPIRRSDAAAHLAR